MDRRPVGFLDSGLGGISVLKEALRLLPQENYLFYGDTAHIPYGDKRPEEVLALTRHVVEQLTAKDCKAIVIACNTATSAAAGQLRQELQMPVIGVEPALKPASLLSGMGQVLVMATNVTLTQPKFKALMEKYGANAVPVPCPGLMELVEAGKLEGPEVRDKLASLLGPYRDKPVKAVVLGCTHYPFLRKEISAFFDGRVPLVDGNEGTVRQLKRRLAEENLLSDGPGGQVTFLSSKEDRETMDRMQAMLALVD